MAMLRGLGSQAATHSNGAYTPASALQELSVCLCGRNTDLERAVTNCFTRVSGNQGTFMHGATCLTFELA
jgi:hypothetical protein